MTTSPNITRLKSVQCLLSSRKNKPILTSLEDCEQNFFKQEKGTNQMFQNQKIATSSIFEVFSTSISETKQNFGEISPTKSNQTSAKIKKINVTSSKKLKTEFGQQPAEHTQSSLYSYKAQNKMKWACFNQQLTNSSYQKLTHQNHDTQEILDQKQQIAKKMGIKRLTKTKNIKNNEISDFDSIQKKLANSHRLNREKQVKSIIQEEVLEKKLGKKETFKQNSSPMKSHKILNHNKKNNIRLYTTQNLSCQSQVQSCNDNSKLSWIILSQIPNTFVVRQVNNPQTPINKLQDCDDDKKVKFFQKSRK